MVLRTTTQIYTRLSIILLLHLLIVSCRTKSVNQRIIAVDSISCSYDYLCAHTIEYEKDITIKKDTANNITNIKIKYGSKSNQQESNHTNIIRHTEMKDTNLTEQKGTILQYSKDTATKNNYFLTLYAIAIICIILCLLFLCLLRSIKSRLS